MNVLLKSKNIPIWSVALVALGIHGLILAIPIALDDPQEKPKSSPVKMQKLPPSKVSVLPKPNAPPAATIVPPAAIASSLAPTVIPSVAPAVVQNSAPSPPVQPATSVQPVTPPVQPVTSPAVPPKTPDVFQIQGTTACKNVKDCYMSTETNGRSIVQTLQQRLQVQGYTLTPIELEEETGMKVYHLFQNGQPKDYLHIIWSDKGTRSLRLPQLEKDRNQLALRVRL